MEILQVSSLFHRLKDIESLVVEVSATSPQTPRMQSACLSPKKLTQKVDDSASNEWVEDETLGEKRELRCCVSTKAIRHSVPVSKVSHGFSF